MCRSILLLAIVLLVLPTVPARAGITDLEGAIHVEWHPDPLTLRPGETGTIRMQLRNDSNVTINVSFLHMWVPSPFSPGMNVTPDFLRLQPGEVQYVRVTIRSYASFSHRDESMDGYVLLRWGRNLTREGADENPTWDGQAGIDLPIKDDFTRTGALLGASVAMILVSVIVVVYILRRRRPGP